MKSRWKRRTRLSRSAGSQKGIVPTAEIHGGHIKLLDEPHADKSGAIVGLVVNAGAVDACAAGCEFAERRSLADVCESSDTLQPKVTDLKRPAGGKEAVVRFTGDGRAAASIIGGQAGVAVVRGQQRSRNTGTVVLGMAHPLEADLVVANSKNVITLSDGPRNRGGPWRE